MRALRIPIVLLALVPLACSSGAATTTIHPALADMPEACVDALVDYLRAIEPAVEGVDFENIGEDELASVMAELEAASGETTAEIDGLQCPSPEGSDDEALAAVIALAEREAPGTVGYLEWIAVFAAGFPDLGEASGDCEADMAALQSVVDDGRTMSDLTMAQVVEVAGLAASVSTNCSPERAEEFFARKDVAAFLEEG